MQGLSLASARLYIPGEIRRAELLESFFYHLDFFDWHFEAECLLRFHRSPDRGPTSEARHSRERDSLSALDVRGRRGDRPRGRRIHICDTTGASTFVTNKVSESRAGREAQIRRGHDHAR